MSSSRRSRRSSALGRLSTRIRGQPLAIAARACCLRLGYCALLKRSRCTVDGRLLEGLTLIGAGGGAAGGGGDVEPLPVEQGQGRLSQFIFSPAPETVALRGVAAIYMWLGRARRPHLPEANRVRVAHVEPDLLTPRSSTAATSQRTLLEPLRAKLASQRAATCSSTAAPLPEPNAVAGCARLRSIFGGTLVEVRFPSLKARRVRSILCREPLGYEIARQSGSHRRLESRTGTRRSRSLFTRAQPSLHAPCARSS